jgi:hypothetical protein
VADQSPQRGAVSIGCQYTPRAGSPGRAVADYNSRRPPRGAVDQDTQEMDMKRLLMAAAVCGLLAVPVLATVSDDTKLGAGVTLAEATPIAKLLETPEAFVGKTIRVDGVATNVCEDMGCWMAIGDSATAEKTVRMKVEDGVIVIPVSAKGKKVSAEGVWEVAGASGHGDHPAPAADPNAPKRYQLKGTGAVIK